MNKHAVDLLRRRVLLLALASGLGLAACSESTPKDPNAWKTEDNWAMAHIMMEDYVKMRLKAPATADFPWADRDQVRSLGDHKYRVASYVDAQNSFGAKIRTPFIGEIEQIGEDRWQLLSLELME